MSREQVKLGAYFYPLTTYCPERRERANRLGRALNISGLVDAPNEFEVIKEAPRLFPAHEQPQYSIDPLTARTEWDDYQASDLAEQLALAQRFNLSYFIFVSYDGMKNGKPVRELHKPLDLISEMCRLGLGLHGFKYAKMQALESPRVVMPIPRQESGGFFDEPNRAYDLTEKAAHFIVDSCIEDWRNVKDYLYVRDSPYLSLLMPPSISAIPSDRPYNQLPRFVNSIRDYAYKRYGCSPYLVGVTRRQRDVRRWAECDVDAITQYCDLPDIGPGAQSIQDYGELMDRRVLDWNTLQKDARSKFFLPSISAGWDASGRGARGYTLTEVEGVHPYTPIVVGSTAKEFEFALRQGASFIIQNAPDGERLLTTFAWNEIGEKSALLGRVGLDGTIDLSYLQTIKRVAADATIIW